MQCGVSACYYGEIAVTGGGKELPCVPAAGASTALAANNGEYFMLVEWKRQEQCGCIHATLYRARDNWGCRSICMRVNLPPRDELRLPLRYFRLYLSQKHELETEPNR